LWRGLVVGKIDLARGLISTAPKQSSSSSSLVEYETSEGIAKITLNNPQKRNALSLDLLLELRSLLRTLGSSILPGSSQGRTENSASYEKRTARERERVLIVASKGSVFSSGHDLKELEAASRDKREEIFRVCSEVMTSIATFPLPVVGQVQGLATAAGCQLVASCDIVLASSLSSFATPGVKIGLFCTTPAVALTRAVPRKKAMEMLFTGEPITAEEAKLYGLINHVVAPESLEQETLKMARRIASSSGEVLMMGKRGVQQQQREANLSDAYKKAEQVMCLNMSHDDALEGIRAFLQKRQPTWSS